MKDLLACVALLALVLGVRPAAGAIEDAGSLADAGEIASDAAASEAPDVAVVARQARDIRALGGGRLDPTIDPATLFDVSLADADAVRVDAERLRMLLREVDAAARSRGKTRQRERSRAVDGGGADQAPGIDATLWNARIDLDRARLEFYDVPADRRVELLAAHEPLAPDATAPLSEAELQRQAADEQQQVALDAAQVARTEAERLASTELARLIGVQRSQATFDATLVQKRKDVDELRDVTIGWQQRALEAHDHPGPSADGTYDDLRRALRSARDSLAGALDQLASAPSEIPAAGPDALADLRVAVDTSPARIERDRVETEARRLGTEEESIRRQRAAALFDEIDTLNHARLTLLPALSPAKRGAVTGFTSAGWDQAASEARQLTLILRYHRHVVGRWLAALGHPDHALEQVLTGGAFQLFEWLLAIGAFVWWRRRSTAILAAMLGRAKQEDRRARLPKPSFATRALSFLAQVHAPVEWLALLFVLKWFLPEATQELLEVRVLSVLMIWIFGAALAVDTINAIAGAEHRAVRSGELDTGALRLRSLRFVGWIVVAFGLILTLSEMLVGRGTIYQWVFSTCWLASIPVLLVLVRWWRSVVFRRTEEVRRPSRIQRWVLAHREGWTSFVAATAGGAYLFASGGSRGARNWVGRFVVTRRALAYLFRRQLGKMGEQTRVVGPVPGAAFESLGPERPPGRWISNDSDEALERLAGRIRERRGGVIALVGERGMGKTASLARLRGDHGDTLLVDSPSASAEALRARVAESLGLPHDATFEEAAATLSSSPNLHALLLDNAQRFVHPVMGGLAEFDALLAAASRHTSTTTWVFALDDVIWPFLARARGARPLFDDVILLERWTEGQIVRLLQTRTGEAGLSPTFEHLLEPLPATADEVDKQEALVLRGADYYRLVWDSARGNPGVALHMWRSSLGTDTDGKSAVRVFTPLDTTDLERLPDASVFVLRAVLQLAPARLPHIVRGTLLRATDVADALRYAASRGYVEEREGGYCVTWTWFRAITLFLQRKHLLVLR